MIDPPEFGYSRPSLRRAPSFRGTTDLKFSAAEQAAIRDAEAAFGYRSQQMPPAPRRTHGLARLWGGAFAVWLAFSVLVGLGRLAVRGISSASDLQRASLSEPARDRRAASRNTPPTDDPRSSFRASQTAPTVTYVNRDRGRVLPAKSDYRQMGHHLPASLTVLPLNGVRAAALAWPSVRVPEPARFRRLRRKKHSLLRRALGGMGHVLEGVAKVAAVPLRVWTDGLLSAPQPFPYSAPSRAERRPR